MFEAASMAAKRGLDRETLDLVLQSIRDFTRANVPDSLLLELDEQDRSPEELVRQMGGSELGLQLLFIPECYGGMGGGAFDVYRVCEAMGGLDMGLATGVLATFLGSDPIVFGGTESQKEHWLGRIADEGLLMAYAATEPQAGSDLAAIKSKAEPLEELGEVVAYRLNGSKQWISNGGYADVYTFLANAPQGPSWFVVERDADGLSAGNPEEKHGIRLSNTSTVTCDDVLVPAANLVGGVEGRGLMQAQLVFGYTRLMVAAFGLGAGWAAMDRAVPYSVERVQGGGPLSEKQGYTHKLIVPHVVNLEAARAVIEETAERIDAGEGNLNTEGAVAKYLATEYGHAAADASIQALGGYGYAREYMVEKIARDVRITRIYEGTSEIMEMTIGRDRWQAHLKSRGQYYQEQAQTLEAAHAGNPTAGADLAGLTLSCLGKVLEAARAGRLTRNQHVLFRLGRLIARAEGAASLARRAIRAQSGALKARSDGRFDGEGLGALSRVYARQAAQAVASEGLALVAGASEPGSQGASALQRDLDLERVTRCQEGLTRDQDLIADLIYQRG